MPCETKYLAQLPQRSALELVMCHRFAWVRPGYVFDFVWQQYGYHDLVGHCTIYICIYIYNVCDFQFCCCCFPGSVDGATFGGGLFSSVYSRVSIGDLEQVEVLGPRVLRADGALELAAIPCP